MSAAGNLFVISAPSGTGKTTLVHTLIESTPNLTVSISHTTRPKRPAETHGINYFFVDKPEFQRMIDAGEFLEHAVVFNQLYGTSHQWVETALNQGKDVILEIDWQGSQQILRKFADSISIFILPPSVEALAERLRHRNQDSPQVIEQRLADFKETVKHIKEYDYIVINDDFETALNDLKSIVLSARLLRYRQIHKVMQILK